MPGIAFCIICDSRGNYIAVDEKSKKEAEKEPLPSCFRDLIFV